MILVRDSLVSQPSSTYSYNENGISCQSVVLHTRSQTEIRISNLYRPPNLKEEDDLRFLDFLRHSMASCSNKYSLITGDFNINWDDSSSNVCARYRQLFEDEFSYRQTVHLPTHKKSILDLVFDSNNIVSDVKILSPLSSSDHNSVLFQISIPDSSCKQVSLTIPTPCFSKTDFNSMKTLLSKVSWEEVFDLYLSIDDIYERFCTVIHSALAICTPMNTVIRQQTLPSYLQRLIRYRNYLFDRSHIPQIREKFINISKRLNKKIVRYKSYIEQKIVAKASSKVIYKFINSRMKTKKNGGIPSLIDSHGNLVYSDSDKAELLSDYFSTVFVAENGHLPTLDANKNSKLNTFSLLPYEVESALKKLNTSFSIPSDGIPQEVFRKLHKELSLPLAHIFNLSLFSGTVPTIWKMSIVTPVPKVSTPSKCSEYRPISITCPSCKVLETLVKSRLDEWIEHNKILPVEQFGFRSSHSTVHQLLGSQHYILSNLNKGKSVDAIYYDVSKAFDSVSHEKLLFILSQLGIGGALYAWIKSFLVGRKFCVKVKGVCSSWNPVISGVPQGSVLGPLFFILYIYDLPRMIQSGSCHISIYADDIKSISAFDNYSLDLETLLEKLATYMISRQLKLSVEKTKVVHYGNKNPENFYALGDRLIESTSCIRDLGVFIDNQLSFVEHINRKLQLANQTMFTILKTFHTVNTRILIMLFKSLVLSKLLYASPVWFPSKVMLLNRIENIQKVFTRILYCRKFKVSPQDSPNYIARCKLFELSLVCEKATAIDLKLFKQVFDNKTPLIARNYYTFSTREAHRSNRTILQVPMCKHTAWYDSFFVRTSRWSSMLPNEFYSDSIDLTRSAKLICQNFS